MSKATTPDPTPHDADVMTWDDVTAADHADPTYQTAYAEAEADLADEIERHQASLSALRRARGLTQVQLAKALGTTQGEVSRIERQSDLFLSTLRSYIEAAGGELVLLARLPGIGEVEVDIEELEQTA
jgi:hypothetical protein